MDHFTDSTICHLRSGIRSGSSASLLHALLSCTRVTYSQISGQGFVRRRLEEKSTYGRTTEYNPRLGCSHPLSPTHPCFQHVMKRERSSCHSMRELSLLHILSAGSGLISRGTLYAFEEYYAVKVTGFYVRTLRAISNECGALLSIAIREFSGPRNSLSLIPFLI